MPVIQNEELKIQNKIRFIEAAQALIDEEGLEKISIRKIAEKAGFHNSTIYLYFRDMDELVMLATMKHFDQYSRALSRLSTQNLSAADTFLAIWSFYGHTVFRKPQIFYNFFFGKYSNDLTTVMEEYYRLFPEEKVEYSHEIRVMYFGRNIRERCLYLLQTLSGTVTTLQKENIELINDIVVCCLRTLLEEKCQDPSLDPGDMTTRLLSMIRYVVRI